MEAALAATPNVVKRLLLKARVILSKRTLVTNPYLVGKFLPYKPDQIFYLLPKSKEHAGERSNGFPIPPEHLRMVSSGESNEIFINSGKDCVNKMKNILGASDFVIQPGVRVLDFGCGAGRIIRWLDDAADGSEVWGADISAEHIIWLQQHLSPPFRFVTVTATPHLPFEDSYFDLIYCFSVFTHIDDLADTWLLEMKRILKPGGRLFITIQDKHSLRQYMNQNWWLPDLLRAYDKKEMISKRDFSMFTIGRGHQSQVFDDIDYLQHHWGCILDIVSVTQHAYSDQNGHLIEEISDGRGTYKLRMVPRRIGHPCS
jgi:ubiquinone/menaquinone biosynthesis C-methylase UbiE